MLHQHARPAVAAAYLAGAIAGALLSAFALLLLGGLLTPIPATWRATVAVASLVLLAAHAAGVVCLDLPQREWQIPQEMFHRSAVEAAFRFAAILGTGVRTFITSPALYALGVVLILAPPVGLAASALAFALAGVGFGVGRSVIVAVQALLGSGAVAHDQRWLTAASWLAIAACFGIAVRALTVGG